MLSFLPVQTSDFESWTYLKVKAQKLKCENTGWGPEKLRSFQAQFQSKHITVMSSVLQKHPALHGMQRGAGSALNAVESLWDHLPPSLAADSPEYPWEVCLFPRQCVQIHKSKDVENLWFILFKK